MMKFVGEKGKYDVFDIGRGKAAMHNRNKPQQDNDRFVFIVSMKDVNELEGIEKATRKTRGEKSIYAYMQNKEKETTLLHRKVVGLEKGVGKGYEVHHAREYEGLQKSLNNSRTNLFILNKDEHRTVHKKEKEWGWNKTKKFLEMRDERNRQDLGLMCREDFLRDEEVEGDLPDFFVEA
ncbi:hypothetical protein [Pontibacillus chungwhensis]|uniref:HNH endonuclease n=2 Tax=Pontibacillus TaxID=289201 RepID=A0ABY8V4H3_9BACI|nr:hypothetical protein [Pontibacillus chungwhensis]MCD5326166.1 hypothetical protein [Pontibacillus sp. HN14]WIG00319.1 hypothetical protein QNI29_20950 [Pontibacillus chungwhensis]